MMRGLAGSKLALLLGIAGLLSLADAMPLRAEASPVMQLAKAKTVAGKGVTGACKEFAEDLFGRMNQAGVEAYLVRFQWEAGFEVGRHVIVVFRDEKGGLYGMDNESSSPRKMKGVLPRDWAKQFARGSDAEVYGTRATDMARFANQGQTLVALVR
jgi:hypothetical protein